MFANSTHASSRTEATTAIAGAATALSASRTVRATACAIVMLGLAGCGDNLTPSPSRAAYDGGAATPLACTPNLDGTIESSELIVALGVSASYLVSPQGKERTVDLVGATGEKGSVTWRFGADYADDQVAKLTGSKLEGKWYAASFAGLASPFVAPIDAASRTEGVYTLDASELRLHGIASATEAPPEGKTILVYDTPISIYRFPIRKGASWKSVSTVRNATLRGLPYAGRDTYEMNVDATGTLTLKDYTLTQAHRVRTLITLAPSAGQTTTQRQTSFLFECLGEVARATSRLNEPEENFTTAAELRRLGISGD